MRTTQAEGATKRGRRVAGRPGAGRRAHAFDADFLARLLDAEAPPTAAAAAVAGPWEVEAREDGWAVVGAAAVLAGEAAAGEAATAGDDAPAGEAAAVCAERQDALLLAAALPGSVAGGLRLASRRGSFYGDGRGFELRAGGRAIGSLAWFDTRLAADLETLRCLVASPRSLALLLEAAGHDALDRAGRLLAARVAAAAEG